MKWQCLDRIRCYSKDRVQLTAAVVYLQEQEASLLEGRNADPQAFFAMLIH